MAVTLSAEETLNLQRKLPKVLYKPYRKRLYQVHLSTDGNQTYNWSDDGYRLHQETYIQMEYKHSHGGPLELEEVFIKESRLHPGSCSISLV